jgi:hypothetical protein
MTEKKRRKRGKKENTTPDAMHLYARPSRPTVVAEEALSATVVGATSLAKQCHDRFLRVEREEGGAGERVNVDKERRVEEKVEEGEASKKVRKGKGK